MRLVLCGITAYEFWRSSLSILPPDFTGFINSRKLTDFSQTTCRDVSKLLADTAGSTGVPLELLVESPEERRHAPGVRCHCLPRGIRLPSGSIYQISDEISVVSPGLCFLQLAEEYDDLMLARAGCELTSLYKRDFFLNRNLVQTDENSFTKQDLICYLNALPEHRGIMRAKRIAGWVVERTRSPREISMDLLMSMPTRQGGYQLPGVSANVGIPLDDRLQKLARREHLECDALLPNGDIMEYNSSTHHDTDEELEFDFEKITALQTLGHTVFPVSTRQFNDFEKFDTIMSSVTERLDLRRVPPKPGTLMLRRSRHESLLLDEKGRRQYENMVETARWQLIMSRSQ